MMVLPVVTAQELTKYDKDVEIKPIHLIEDYNISKEATLLGVLPSSLINVKLTEFDGKADVKLEMLKNVTTYIDDYYNCNCRMRIPDSKNISDTAIQECDLCVQQLPVIKEIFAEINPETDVIKSTSIIKESFKGCSVISQLANGHFGCSVWTDLILMGETVEGATWWNETWWYRKNITIFENSNHALSDYQVKLLVNTITLIGEDKMNPDCSDMRFTNATGDIVNHYIETDECNETDSVIWLRVPTIPSGLNTTISMYYGNNTSVNSTSSGLDTFLMFDNFEYDDDPLNHGWVSPYSSTGYFNTTSATSIEGIRSLMVNKSGVPNGNLVYNLSKHHGVYFVEPSILDVRISGRKDRQNYMITTDFIDITPANIFSVGFRDTGWISYANPAWSDILDDVNGTWYDLRYKINYTSDTFDIFIDDVYQVTPSFTAVSSTLEQFIFSTGSSNTGIGYWDYFHAFKNISVNEPNYTFGVEEYAFTPPLVLPNATNVTYAFDLSSTFHLDTCIDDDTLLIEWNTSSAYEYQLIPCPHGCIEDITVHGDACSNPDYLNFAIIILIVLFSIITIGMFKGKKRKW